MIGNEKDALFIHNWHHGQRLWPGSLGAHPEGWKYLGSGAFRAAYLSPEGVVYKVQIDRWYSIQSNHSEYETWKRLYFGCKMPKYSRLPKLSYYPVPEMRNLGVIAIEQFHTAPPRWGRVEGAEGEYWDDVLRRVSRTCRVDDLRLNGGNVFLDEENNLLVPTDLGDSW